MRRLREERRIRVNPNAEGSSLLVFVQKYVLVVLPPETQTLLVGTLVELAGAALIRKISPIILSKMGAA
jgi:hypothetical protein